MKIKSRIMAIMLVVITLLVFVGCQEEDIIQEKPIISVSVSTVGQGDVRTADYLHGTIKAAEEVSIIPMLSAEVRGVFVTVGASVKKGDRMVSLDKDAIEKQSSQARTTLEAARNQLATAKDNVERLERLYLEGAVAEQQYTNAKAQYEQIRDGSFEPARIALSQVNDQLKNAVITAPMSGVVGFINAQAGQMVSPSAPIASVLDLSVMEASFGLTEGQINRVELGTNLDVSIDAASEEPFQGKIIEVSPQADPQTRLFAVTVEIPNPDKLIKSGMSASISMVQEEIKDALLVPEDAVRHTQVENIVFVLQDDIVRQVSVEILLSDGTIAAITGDLKPGDMVVVLGKERLSDGTQVRVVDEGGQS